MKCWYENEVATQKNTQQNKHDTKSYFHRDCAIKNMYGHTKKRVYNIQWKVVAACRLDLLPNFAK